MIRRIGASGFIFGAGMRVPDSASVLRWGLVANANRKLLAANRYPQHLKSNARAGIRVGEASPGRQPDGRDSIGQYNVCPAFVTRGPLGST